MESLRIVCFLIDSIGVASPYENKFVPNRRRRYRAAPRHRLFPSQNRLAGCYYYADFFFRENRRARVVPRDRGGNSSPRRERRSITAKSQRRLRQLSLHRCARDVLFRTMFYVDPLTTKNFHVFSHRVRAPSVKGNFSETCNFEGSR